MPPAKLYEVKNTCHVRIACAATRRRLVKTFRRPLGFHWRIDGLFTISDHGKDSLVLVDLASDLRMQCRVTSDNFVLREKYLK
jgi:hypothetical protein